MNDRLKTAIEQGKESRIRSQEAEAARKRKEETAKRALFLAEVEKCRPWVESDELYRRVTDAVARHENGFSLNYRDFGGNLEALTAAINRVGDFRANYNYKDEDREGPPIEFVAVTFVAV